MDVYTAGDNVCLYTHAMDVWCRFNWPCILGQSPSENIQMTNDNQDIHSSNEYHYREYTVICMLARL